MSGASHDLLRCAATLDGGEAGGVYRVTNRVTLSDGQIDERSLTLRVEER
ncbi:phage fiber-tail adaptor protein [Sphingopyxis sp. Root1497]